MFYDPMIAKLVTHAPTREAAIDLQAEALDAFHIDGIQHNIPFLTALMQHPRWRSGRISTGFIKEEYPAGFVPRVAAGEEDPRCPACGGITRATVVLVEEVLDADDAHRAEVRGDGGGGLVPPDLRRRVRALDPGKPQRMTVTLPAAPERFVHDAEHSTENGQTEDGGDHVLSPYTFRPEKPMKASASRLMVTNEIGAPAKAAGTRARAMRSRNPAKMSSTMVKPSAEPKP